MDTRKPRITNPECPESGTGCYPQPVSVRLISETKRWNESDPSRPEDSNHARGFNRYELPAAVT